MSRKLTAMSTRRLAMNLQTRATPVATEFSGRRAMDVARGDGATTAILRYAARTAETPGFDPAKLRVSVAGSCAGTRPVRFAPGSTRELRPPDCAADIALLRGVLYRNRNPDLAIEQAAHIAGPVEGQR